MDVVRERLEKDTKLKDRTSLEVGDIMVLLGFVVRTTYFKFRKVVYQQKFGAAMGSPVSPIVANLYMEYLEQEALKTAGDECKPRLWKRYVDDVLEIVKKEQVDSFTNHLNQVDKTGNIRFTYESEQDGSMPFLDTLIVRKEDGTLKLVVYRKKTHTDQYLNYQSHHPLHQKLGVVRTLLDRCDNIITETEDKIREENRIREALQKCGYPSWAVSRVKRKREEGKQQEQSKEKEECTGQVVIPYVKGVSERAERIFRKYGIRTAMKPMNTLRQLLVHPKDKREREEICECVYEIPCAVCERSYIGETGRSSGLRLKEH